jgi:hypothetical protein
MKVCLTETMMWIAIGMGALLTAAVWVGCYKGNPPCNPGTVDYPRCDPTQPSWAAHADAGQK